MITNKNMDELRETRKQWFVQMDQKLQETYPKEVKRRVMSKFLRDVVKQVETMIGYYLNEKKSELQTKPAIS